MYILLLSRGSCVGKKTVLRFFSFQIIILKSLWKKNKMLRVNQQMFFSSKHTQEIKMLSTYFIENRLSE